MELYREGERVIFHLLVFIPQMASVTKFGQVEPQSLEVHLGLPHEWRGYKQLGHPLLPSRYISRELDQLWNSWGSNRS